MAGQSIQLFGRNSVSGTYGYFKEHALCKGDFRNNVNEQPGSASVVQGVSESLNGLGYSGIGYKTASVRALPLAKRGDAFIEATPKMQSAERILCHDSYVYVNKAPNKPLDPMITEFVKLLMSKQGQEVVVKDGYVPLPAAVTQRVCPHWVSNSWVIRDENKRGCGPFFLKGIRCLPGQERYPGCPLALSYFCHN